MPGNLQSIPASVIASWPTPNYVDPVQRTWLPIYAGVLQGITTVLVVTRLVLRYMNKAGPLGLDDALLVPAFLAATMFTTLIMLSCIRYGTDRHIWDVPIYQFEDTALIAWLSELAFLVSTSATKISILLFYRRLVKGTYSKIWIWATLSAIAFTACYCIVFVLLLVFACRPTDAYWKATSPFYTKKFHCSDTTIANPLSGALSVFSDLYSVILPMVMMRHFNSDRRRKCAMNFVFSLGLLVVGAGIARTYYLNKLGYDYDSTWVGFDVFLWAELETQLAIICACAPSLRVLFRHYLKDQLSRAMQTGHSTGLSGSVTIETRDWPKQKTGLPAQSPAKQDFHSSLEAMRDPDVESVYASRPSTQQSIRTPAEFEQYALKTLDKCRRASQQDMLARRSDADMHNRERSETTNAEPPVPRSWLDTDTQ